MEQKIKEVLNEQSAHYNLTTDFKIEDIIAHKNKEKKSSIYRGNKIFAFSMAIAVCTCFLVIFNFWDSKGLNNPENIAIAVSTNEDYNMIEDNALDMRSIEDVGIGTLRSVEPNNYSESTDKIKAKSNVIENDSIIYQGKMYIFQGQTLATEDINLIMGKVSEQLSETSNLSEQDKFISSLLPIGTEIYSINDSLNIAIKIDNEWHEYTLIK